MRNTWSLWMSWTVLITSVVCVHCSSSSSSDVDSGSVDSSASAPDSSSTPDSAPEAGSVSLACSTLGNVSHRDAGTCSYPTDVCCSDYTQSSCTPPPACGAKFAWSCAGSADCSSGEICCVAVQNAGGQGTASCQPSSTCPSSLLSAQLCKTNADCTNGSACIMYDCAGVFFPQACAGTLSGLAGNQCSVYLDAGAGAAVPADAGADTGVPADAGADTSTLTDAAGDSGSTE
jgi:hypothetical protein